MKKDFLLLIIFLVFFQTTAHCEITNITVQWKQTNSSFVEGYKIYYSYDTTMQTKKLACDATVPDINELTCENVDIEKYPVYFSVAAVLRDKEVFSAPKIFYPPDDIQDFNATSDQLDQIKLSWTDPDKSDFKGVMIRFSAVQKDNCSEEDFPQDHTQGSFVVDLPGNLGEVHSYIHENLSSDLVYCYSAFAYDSYENFTHSAHASARPLIANSPPVIKNFLIVPSELENPKSIVSVEVLAEDQDGDLLTYSYDFGDGVKLDDSTNSVSHVYLTKGTYNLSVTVSDAAGSSVSQTKPVVVDNLPPHKVTSLKVE